MEDNFEIIEGIEAYVIDSENLPDIPMSWTTDKERIYAKAITKSILDGTFKKPGFYGVIVTQSPLWKDRLDVTICELLQD